MIPIELLLSKLPHARRSGTGWVAPCPAHDDKHPSLSIREGDTGAALVHCHAGCTPNAVTGALGLKVSDLMPMPRKPDAKRAFTSPSTLQPRRLFATADDAVKALELRNGQHAARWTYVNAVGEPIGAVVRWNWPGGGKDVRPLSKAEDRPGWIIGAMPSPRPLYQLPKLLTNTHDCIYISEGEKSADVLASLGLLATTSAGGAKSAYQTDWTPLTGREVVIVPDNDSAGGQYADDVASILANLRPSARVRVVHLRDAWEALPVGGDIADVREVDSFDAINAKLSALVAAAESEPLAARAPEVQSF